MSDLVKLDSKLPAHLRGKGTTTNVFAAAKSAGGYPVISIKGKVFHMVRGDERTLVTKPDDDDEPATNLNVVIIAANPHKSKVYYAEGYEEGSTAAPDCYSNNGETPEMDAENPQAKKCATCPHNQWGSRITDGGKKGKACSDSMRLAVAPAGQLNDPMLLRVPAASLKILGNYGEELAKRGVEPKHVITRVGFDYDVAHPALKFRAIGFVDAEQLEEIEATEQDEIIGLITGTVAGAAGYEADTAGGKAKALEDAEDEADAKPTKASVDVDDDDDDDDGEPVKPATRKAPAKKASRKKATVQVEDDDDEDAPPPKKKAAVVEVEDYDSIDEGLDDFDFDD